MSYGQNHIKFWTLQRPGAPAPTGAGANSSSNSSSGELAIAVDSGTFGKASVHSVLSACFLPSGVVLTGSPEGSICVWKGCKLVRVVGVGAHAKGPLSRRADGTESYGGVRCLVLREGGQVLLSAGADG